MVETTSDSETNTETSMEKKKKRHSGSPRSGKTGVKTVKEETEFETAKRREALKETLRQNFELEQKTLRIVERLLEDNVADDFLIDCARFITPDNYKDTVEERSIVKICGYPVCPNKLGNVPKQQYLISTKTNKVYDITERKCFCSNFCYKASKHFEVQISKTPLWLREEERPPDIKLLKKGERGISGEEVKIVDQPISELEIENPESLEPVTSKDPADSGSESSDPEQDFVSSLVTGGGAGLGAGILKHKGERRRNTAKACTDEGDREKDRDTKQPVTDRDGDKLQPPSAERNQSHEGIDKPDQAVDGTTDGESSDPEQDFVSSLVNGGGEGLGAGILKHKGERRRNTAKACTDEGDREKDRDTKQPVIDRDGDKLQPPSAERNQSHEGIDKPDQAVDGTTDLLSRFRIGEGGACVDENSGQPGARSTLETGLNITQVGMSRRGAAQLRNLLNALGPGGAGQGKDPTFAIRASLLEGLSRTLREWSTEETLVLLYGPRGRPREKEEEEEELDEDDLEESVEKPAPPVPVGGGQGKPSAPAPDYPTLRREAELINLRVQEFYTGVSVEPEEENTEDLGGKDPALPLVDSHAQLSIQKRIVSEKLNRSLRDILGHLKLAMSDISTDLNNLLRTFRFTNSNIIHNHPEWTLIAVVLLSVLSEVTPVLQESLERPCSVEYISTLMRELCLKDQDLQSLVQLFRGQAN